jgi:hypothetical protein
MLPFFTSFKVDVDKHTLKPYMASVNHNLINEITWLNIVHTLMGFFFLENDGKNDTTPMVDMGNDACVIVGSHNKVSVFMLKMQYFPIWKTMLEMSHNLRGITTCFISKTVITKL